MVITHNVSQFYSYIVFHSIAILVLSAIFPLWHWNFVHFQSPPYQTLLSVTFIMCSIMLFFLLLASMVLCLLIDLAVLWIFHMRMSTLVLVLFSSRNLSGYASLPGTKNTPCNLHTSLLTSHSSMVNLSVHQSIVSSTSGCPENNIQNFRGCL